MKFLPDVLTLNPPPLKELFQGSASPLALASWINRQEWLWQGLVIGALGSAALYFGLQWTVSKDIVKTLQHTPPKFYKTMDMPTKAAILSTLGTFSAPRQGEDIISWIYLTSPPPDDYKAFLAKTANTYVASINADTGLRDCAKNWDGATPQKRLAALQRIADLYTQKTGLPPIQISRGALPPEQVSVFRQTLFGSEIIFNNAFSGADQGNLDCSKFWPCVSALGHELMHYTSFIQAAHPEKTPFSPATKEWLKLVHAEWSVPLTEDMPRPPSEVIAYGFEAQIQNVLQTGTTAPAHPRP